eukprot:m.307017 g.307017  ORF g.307017 m.307017 type:complete len:95 (+) comp41819_c0_seq1:48-332(+)
MTTDETQTKQPGSQDPFEEYYWMENTEEYDQQLKAELEKEEEIEEELDDMLDDEEEIRDVETFRLLQKNAPPAADPTQNEVSSDNPPAPDVKEQ